MGPPDDKYDTVEFVAEGGMARVYRARRRSSGHIVAVREISAGPGSEERIASERRGAEIQRALCEIDSRVPRVFEIFLSAAGWLYVEMEYIDGEDLSAITQRGPLPVADAVRIAVGMFDFLRIAHSTPVSVDGEQRNQQVHGDLTPRNVRIATDGAVRILDFGIAKGLKATVTAVSFANYGYVSPERARTGWMGVSDDFWSAGVVLYEMLSGRRAFPGTYEQISAALADRRNPPAPYASLPVALRLIVAKLLAWDPAYRYADAAAVLAEFDAFLHGRPTRAEAEADAERTRAVGRAAGADPVNEIEPRHESRTTAIPPRPRRPRRLLRAAGLAAAVIVFAHESSVWQDAEARSRVAAADTGDVESLWSDYEALRDRAWLPSATSGLARVVAGRLVSAASTTLKDYRQDEPRIRERHVEAARSQLVRAVELQPANVLAHAWLRYAQGHLARIAGDAKRGDERRQAWAQAVERFDEASRFAPDLLDPYLGLTRLYTHREYRDPDRARRAMSAAERLGHPRGMREHGQLGDLFKDEGDLLFKQARDVRGTGSEEPLLVRARAELVSALGEYEQSKGFGQTNTRIKEINDAVQRIDVRLGAIRGDAEEDGSIARRLEPAPSLGSVEVQLPEPAQGESR